MLIGLFSVVLTLLIYWLLGFVLEDIGRLPGPNYAALEAAQIDPDLKTVDTQLDKSILEVNRQIDNQRRRQQMLRESTTSSQTTLNQLLELQRISIEQSAVLPEDQQQALADSQKLFLENQKKDQEYNDSLSSLQEQLASLQEQQRTHREVLEKAREPVNDEYYRLQRLHDWRVAAIKIGFLTPLLLLGGYLFARHRNGKYAPMIYALDAALLAKAFVVMHEYFPREYFKYVIIVSSLAVIGLLLARLLKMVAEPGKETRLKQAREAYESFQCPVCQFPIRRGPLKFMSWSPRSLKKTSLPIVNAPDEPYTCPSCSTVLYEKCANCGAIRHGLLPACEHCGAEKEV
jgi:preprotein translocase subunit Sss1